MAFRNLSFKISYAVSGSIIRAFPKACRIGFIRAGKACYNIPDMTATWIDALAVCMAQGAYLADITSKAEQYIIAGMAKDVPGLYDLWLGGHHHIAKTWMWIHNDAELTYGNWKYEKPLSNKEKCVAMVTSWGFQWNDWLCGNRGHFVCKYYAE